MCVGGLIQQTLLVCGCGGGGGGGSFFVGTHMRNNVFVCWGVGGLFQQTACVGGGFLFVGRSTHEEQYCFSQWFTYTFRPKKPVCITEWERHCDQHQKSLI